MKMANDQYKNIFLLQLQYMRVLIDNVKYCSQFFIRMSQYQAA
jgi:hypothetical protein